MFSYYGSKSRIVDLYPLPKYGKIIEPFAGSARYALRYFDREVLLVDKYEVIVRVWKYLQQCSPKDILGLPKLKTGLVLDTLNISEEEKMLLGMLAGAACTTPRKKVSLFGGENNNKNKMKNIADSLFKIKHWVIQQGSYEDITNQEATWFIDPPYQFGGHAYVESKIDYGALNVWSIERMGQIIVCENTKANWMNFKAMSKMRGANMGHTVEAIFSNFPTAFDYQQKKLF